MRWFHAIEAESFRTFADAPNNTTSTQHCMNLFDSLPSQLPEELVTVLLQNSTLRIERIVSTGQSSPPDFWYDQTEHEWVVVLQGQAQLQVEQQLIDLRPGDSIHLPAHTKHRVASTAAHEPTVWLAVFYTLND
jgi:cupin 2 domain-containing protein